MTLSAAKARGLARPQRIRPLAWRAHCPNCRWDGEIVETKRAASAQSRVHNTKHVPSWKGT